MTKHPKLNASRTTTPPRALNHDTAVPAQNSPQGNRRQGEEAICPSTNRCNSKVIGQHLDQITAHRQMLLERLAET